MLYQIYGRGTRVTFEQSSISLHNNEVLIALCHHFLCKLPWSICPICILHFNKESAVLMNKNPTPKQK